MKKLTAISLILVVLLPSPVAVACGDKLLHLSRIHRLQAMGLNSTVLVFARPSSLLENASQLNLEKAYKEAGFRLLLVNNEREFAWALQSGAADVVIADIADATSIGRLETAKPVLVIPVVAKDEFKSVNDAKRYPAVIKSPAKAGKFLDAIDRALDSKWARQSAKLQPISISTR